MRLALKSAFTTAAASDALDDSTMHYGHLAKRLRGVRPAPGWERVDEFAGRVHEAICDPATAQRLLNCCEVKVGMPKATLLGTSVFLTSTMVYKEDQQQANKTFTLHLHSINIATLIGVNAHEREHKQPLVFDIWIFDLPGSASGLYSEIEAQLVKVSRSRMFIRIARSMS